MPGGLLYPPDPYEMNHPPRNFVPRLVVSMLALLLIGGGLALLSFKLGPVLRAEVAGESFRAMLSREVSKSIKVDGEFSSLSLGEGWKVETSGFKSTGWPGEAIGALDAQGVFGIFDPWGILHRVWQVDLISIDEGRFVLREPDNALKRPVVPGKKPWYAAVMPSRFHCRWIECARTRVDFPFAGRVGGLRDVRLGATMIGQNLKYYGSGGSLEFPGFPALAMDALEVYVTREMVEVGYAYLRQTSAGDGRLELSGRLGQHEDKSIQARVVIHDFDSAPFLPASLAKSVRGRLTANATYAVDREGKNPSGTGTVRILGGVLDNLPALDVLAKRQRNPDLKRFAFDDVSLNYRLAGSSLDLSRFVISAPGKMEVTGNATWQLDGSQGSADLSFGRMPLSSWLPSKLIAKVHGTATGNVSWKWEARDLSGGHGRGRLSLENGRLKGFQFQDFLNRFFEDKQYLDLHVPVATLQWEHGSDGTHLRNIELLSPGVAGVRGSLVVDGEGRLSGEVLAGASAQLLTWLPDATKTVFGVERDGLHWAKVNLSGTLDDPVQDLGKQVLRQLEKHPFAMARLALKGVSWWLGDLLRPKKTR